MSLLVDTEFSVEESLGNGWFQLRILFCTQLALMQLIFQLLVVEVMSSPVDHWCKPPPGFSSMSASVWKKIGIPIGDDGRHSQCSRYQSLTMLGNVSRVEVPCTAWDYDLPPHVQTVVSEWNLVCERSWLITAMKLYYMMGAFFSIPMTGQLADAIGRQPVILGCVMVALGASVVAFFAKSFSMFVIARIFVAASISSLKVVMIVLLLEVSTPKYRDLYCVLCQLGAVVALIAPLLLRGMSVLDRTVVSLWALMPMSLLLFVFISVHESPHWLLSQGDTRLAHTVITVAGRLNKTNEDVNVLQKHCILSRRETLGHRRMTLLEVYAVPIIRTRSVILSWVWFLILFLLYGLPMINPADRGSLLNILRHSPFIIELIVMYKLLKRYRRKHVLYAVTLLSALLALLSSASAFIDAGGRLEKTLIDSTFFCVHLSAGVMYMYTFELYPTVIRVTGFSAVFFWGRIGAAMSPFLLDLSKATHQSVSLIVAAILMITCPLLLQRLPETKSVKLCATMNDIQPTAVIARENK